MIRVSFAAFIESHPAEKIDEILQLLGNQAATSQHV